MSDMKALVVDDDSLIRRNVAEVLRNDGWEVYEAESAEQAMEMLHRELWPLVFCDVRLSTGESGSGKEIGARAIHCRSLRAARPFVAVNCGAIPSELIESELFGHTRGSFTGATADRRGLWEEADGGTVLLDEITETSPAFQVKLLRTLQEGEIRRVGSNRTQRVDVRVIAATNREPEQETTKS